MLHDMNQDDLFALPVPSLPASPFVIVAQDNGNLATYNRLAIYAQNFMQNSKIGSGFSLFGLTMGLFSFNNATGGRVPTLHNRRSDE